MIKKKATVNLSLKAQLDEELDLVKEEIITVTDIFDDGWCRGYKENGEEGIFPECFITYQEDAIIDKKEKSTLLVEDLVPFIPPTVKKVANKIYSNSSETGYRNLASNYNLFPEIVLSYDKISRDFGEFKIEPIAIAKFSFTAENPNELTFEAGQVIKLIKYIDNEWAEGILDNIRGLFPVSFVKFQYIKSTTSLNDNQIIENNYVSKDHRKVNILTDALEKFIVTRNGKNKIEHAKKLFEPHRAAPSVPVYNKIPLENQKNLTFFIQEKTQLFSKISKIKDQRQNVITELYFTEKDYVRDLKMIYKIFNLHDPGFLTSKGIDVTTLFGNIAEIMYVAEELLELIEQIVNDSRDECQCIGSCFLKMSGKMRSAYGKYCSNHELSLTLLQKYENNKEIMKIFNKAVQALQLRVACFGMHSILIKPVQRILKYSLILNKLLKYTKDDHPSKLIVVEALKVMEDVARYINEYKRKRELASKYLHSNNTLISKMANLNMHSFAKKSSRLGAKLSVTLGLTSLPIDNYFDELEKDFICLEKTMKQFLKDIVECVSYLDNESQCSEILTEHMIQYFLGVSNDKILQLQKIRNVIRFRFLKQLKTYIEIYVLPPLNFLITLLAGPELLINKRHDKMLDYDYAITKNEKFKEKGIVSDDISRVKNNFEALNQQLLEELPIFIQISTEILYMCIYIFIKGRKLYNVKIMKEYLNISEYAIQITMKDMLFSFFINHKMFYDQINRFTYGTIYKEIDKNSVDCFLQSDIHKMALKMKYPHNKLYIVTKTVFGTTSYDLSVIKGTIIGVIKAQDPLGNSSKWFVDNGLFKGFLERQYLELINEMEPVKESKNKTCTNTSINLISLNYANSGNEHFIDLQNLDVNNAKKLEVPSSSINIKTKTTELYKNICTFIYAQCDFDGTEIPGTLSIKKNQILKVLKKHDSRNNSQWWLVQDRTGKKGYVPCNYVLNKET